MSQGQQYAIEDDQQWGGGMVTARLVTNCSYTLRNIHTNARRKITRKLAKRKVGYIFVAQPVNFIHLFKFGNILLQVHITPTLRILSI
jgi:hypothetical protein